MRQLDLQVVIAAETVFQPSTFPLKVLPQLFDVLLKPQVCHACPMRTLVKLGGLVWQDENRADP